MYNNSNSFYIDDITYNDLSLSTLFDKLNKCETTCGEDYLYNRFRNPYIKNCSEFTDFTELASENFDSSDLKKIGKLKGQNFSDFINSPDIRNESNLIHYMLIAFVICSFALIFVFPGPGLVLFFVSIGISVSNYFKNKNILSNRLNLFNYIIGILKCVRSMSVRSAQEKSGLYGNKVGELQELYKIYKPFMRGTFLISSGTSTSGDIVSVILDYLRLIFHVDIIKYNNMIGFISEHRNETKRLYELIGELDAADSIKQFKNEYRNSGICSPEFTNENNLKIQNVYHPLILNPVVNSLDTSDDILITGSNASGKSTFLKTVAINALFSQAFGVSFSEYYKAPYFKIITSMALSDSIIDGDSYFMAEIKSIKRIFDEEDDICILCIIDEVLRGTNTVERISASVEILNALHNKNIRIFAATHDIELTELLCDTYKNYHFSEIITDNDIKFNYLLLDGAANSKNAIKLLSLLGFDKDIVGNAEKRVENFLDTGEYK